MNRRKFLKGLLIGAAATTVPFAITPNPSQLTKLQAVWNGHIAQFIVFDKPLTYLEIRKVQAYLESRYEMPEQPEVVKDAVVNLHAPEGHLFVFGG